MNECITKLMLMLGDFLIKNEVEDAVIKWKDKGENAGKVIIIIKRFKMKKVVSGWFEAKKRQKVMDEVYDWWNKLLDQEQYEVMVDWYPMEITKDTDIDKMFGDMLNGYQLEIYKNNRK